MSTAPDPVLVERHGPIAVLTLNRPERRNPVSEPEMVSALTGALAEVDRDETVRAVILTGAGPAFSSGGDVRKMADDLDRRRDRPTRTQDYYRHGIQRIPLAFEQLEVPVIAAVNGPAIGAGCDLACMCDIRVAAESAKFAESFVKLGIVAGDGGAWLLPRLVGYSRAAELALTGDTIGAAEALAIGLVSRVVPDAELMASATAIAERIAANPPHAVRMTKRLLLEGRNTDLEAALRLAAALQALAHTEPDHRAAVEAFVQRRRPA